MKKILIQRATVVAPGSAQHLQQQDLLIENGRIARMGGNLTPDKDTELVSGVDLHVSAGWFDLRVNFWDPGHEYKEDLFTGCEAAAYGGFTGVGLLPETEPRLSTKSIVEYVKSRTAHAVVDVYPFGAVSKEGDFKELSEMYDLVAAGAVAFSTGMQAIPDSGFLLRAMMYSNALQMPILLHPENKALSGKGQMNEGIVNVQLGIKGSPVLAEEVEVANGISMARYAGSRIHFSGLSSAKALALIDEAAASGMGVTADVSIQHLMFTEEDLLGFNTNLKLRPPLRTADDRAALRQGVLEKPYLSITSEHVPQEDDKKKCEFELAAYGAIGLQTCFSQLRSIYPDKKDWTRALEAFTHKSRQILNLAVPMLEEGAAANLTIFSPDKEWVLDERSNKSKSRNSPVWKQPLKGKAIAVINKGLVKYLS